MASTKNPPHSLTNFNKLIDFLYYKDILIFINLYFSFSDIFMPKRTYDDYDSDHSDAMSISPELIEDTYSAKKQLLPDAMSSAVAGVSIHNSETEITLLSGFMPHAYESFISCAPKAIIEVNTSAPKIERIPVINTTISSTRFPHVITPFPNASQSPLSRMNDSPATSLTIHRVTPFSHIAGNDSRHPIFHSNCAFKQQPFKGQASAY